MATDGCSFAMHNETVLIESGMIGSTSSVAVTSDIGEVLMEFRCNEWSGAVCTQLQGRVPDGECDAHGSGGAWSDGRFFNNPEERICPSFCKAMTGDDTWSECSSGASATTSWTMTGYSTSWSDSECSYSDYRWWTETYTHDSGTFVVRLSDYGTAEPRLNVQCNGWSD